MVLIYLLLNVHIANIVSLCKHSGNWLNVLTFSRNLPCFILKMNNNYTLCWKQCGIISLTFINKFSRSTIKLHTEWIRIYCRDLDLNIITIEFIRFS